ncbi:MAG: hypothetical protein COC19_04390 [SAR86 cluster bacterium]|uniref:Cytochrome c domain-containing protein n=1 Tax=SAR86 cluster bacterium TaxID=2030880 RepID=A0A2A4MP96_9GAMM|nr:MAG: hypothetical protein COC19_04390 [SAR86 cluster bacterium]
MFNRVACIYTAVFSVLISATAIAGVGEGQDLYNAYCQICHGGEGEGQAMGKPLTDSGAERLSDTELVAVITEGRSGTGMAAWGSSFDEKEILDIAGYVRTLQGGSGVLDLGDAVQVSNDPAVLAGEQLFNGVASCATCHTYRDQGGSIGPVLDGISSHLNDALLEQALLNPSQTIAAGFEVKEVELTDGKIIRGRFRNESELALQILSEDGKRWVTYFKARVNGISDSEESLMPDVYATLSAEQQQQIMAFLKSL